ncbi:hypothetical protein [Flavobacterium lindanitolerans]|uniref:hypothetical protein n=1 Tax=Flavobacterium lindanitolerans TaxID=428988 RepID=UPI0031D23B58
MKNFVIQQNVKLSAFLMFMMMNLFLSASASAQNVKVTDYKSLLRKNEQTNQGKVSEVQSLVSNLLPTIFLENEKVGSFDAEAISIETDSQSFSKIVSKDLKTADVQIIKIKLSDKSELNSRFDLSSLNNLPKLKYIYIICPFEVQEAQISNMFKGTNPRVNVIYSAAIPN